MKWFKEQLTRCTGVLSSIALLTMPLQAIAADVSRADDRDHRHDYREDSRENSWNYHRDGYGCSRNAMYDQQGSQCNTQCNNQCVDGDDFFYDGGYSGGGGGLGGLFNGGGLFGDPGSWVIPAVVGAVAGTIAGIVAGNNSGSTGATGPAGAGFTFDAAGNFLTFTYTFTATVPGSTFRPFVTEPNGVTIEGPLSTAVVGLNTVTVTVPGPLPFGTYVAGIAVQTGTLVLTAGTGVLITAFASRDGSTTTLPIALVPALGLAAQSQTSVNFAYDPANIP